MSGLSAQEKQLHHDRSIASSNDGSALVKFPSEKSKMKLLQRNNHPELEDLYMINELNMERCYPNGEVINIDVSPRYWYLLVLHHLVFNGI